MLTLRILSFMTLVVGAFKLFGLRFGELFENFINKPQSIKTHLAEVTNRKKKRFILRQIEEVSEIIRLTGREDKIPVLFYCLQKIVDKHRKIVVVFINRFLLYLSHKTSITQ